MDNSEKPTFIKDEDKGLLLNPKATQSDIESLASGDFSGNGPEFDKDNYSDTDAGTKVFLDITEHNLDSAFSTHNQVSFEKIRGDIDMFNATAKRTLPILEGKLESMRTDLENMYSQMAQAKASLQRLEIKSAISKMHNEEDTFNDRLLRTQERVGRLAAQFEKLADQCDQIGGMIIYLETMTGRREDFDATQN